MLLFRHKKKLTPRARRRRRTIIVFLFFIAISILTVIASRMTGESRLEKLPDAFYQKIYLTS